MIDAKRREEIIQKADHDESRIIDLAEKAVNEIWYGDYDKFKEWIQKEGMPQNMGLWLVLVVEFEREKFKSAVKKVLKDFVVMTRNFKMADTLQEEIFKEVGLE